MSDLYMNVTTNDLLITNGDLSIATLTDAIQQDLQQQLQLYLGEWFLDTSKGIPYLQLILVRNPNLEVIQGLLMNAITAVPGIIEVHGFNFSYDAPSRTLTLTVDAKTTTGSIITVQPSISVTGVSGIGG